MSKVTGGELVVMTLADHGVRNVFSIIGGQMCSIYDSLSHHPEMKLVTVRNEAAAPMMAAGCAAVTGVPSVSMCTVGAGVVYEVAGLMAAWYSYLPVISIAPQVQSWKMKPHQENLQGCNQDEIFAPITKWNAIAYHWDRIPVMVHRALREAQANAPGPTHLDIPVDVLFQLKKFDGNKKSKIMPPAATTRFIGALPGPVEQVKRAGEAIAASRRPLVVIGQGMGRPGRYPDLKARLNGLNLPTLLGDCSSGIMDGRDASYAGALGLFAGSPRGLELIREADLLLIIGLDPEIQDLLRALGKDLPPAVQVEVDPSALLTDRQKFVGVNADPISFLTAVGKMEGVPAAVGAEWLDRAQKAGDDLASEFFGREPRLAALLAGITTSFGDDDIVVVDGAGPVHEAQALARHSTANLTMNVYARASQKRLVDLSERASANIRQQKKCAPGVHQGKNGEKNEDDFQRETNDMSAVVKWCEEGDLNPHRISPTRPSTLRVYQFRHPRNGDHICKPMPAFSATQTFPTTYQSEFITSPRRKQGRVT